MTASEAATRRAIEAVWRIESSRLIGGLVRTVRDVGIAEDLAQEALIAALERWPKIGIPENPGAWLMTTAKNLDLISAPATTPQPRPTTATISGSRSDSEISGGDSFDLVTAPRLPSGRFTRHDTSR
jgi:predicted RNA polymerase sigma factor